MFRISFLYLSSLIDLAQDHCQRLLQSENPEDRVLLEKEETAVNNLRQVEVIAALARYKQLPSGFELCLCDAVQVNCENSKIDSNPFQSLIKDFFYEPILALHFCVKVFIDRKFSLKKQETKI